MRINQHQNKVKVCCSQKLVVDSNKEKKSQQEQQGDDVDKAVVGGQQSRSIKSIHDQQEPQQVGVVFYPQPETQNTIEESPLKDLTNSTAQLLVSPRQAEGRMCS